MNRSKARDLYSDYYENALSPGLRQSMDNAFASDPDLRRDYEEFVLLIGGLESLRQEPIVPVGFLSEKIEARLNQIDLDHRATQKPFLLRFWKPVGATAVAAAALVGFLMALQPQAGGNPATASVLPSSGSNHSLATPKLVLDSGELFLTLRSDDLVRVTVRRGIGGEILESFNVEKNALRSPLRNVTEQPQALEIEFSNSDAKMLVVLPGRRTEPAGMGQGTVLDFAKALAGTYGKPVEVATRHRDSMVNWNLSGADPINQVDDTMKELGITIDVRNSQVLLLAD